MRRLVLLLLLATACKETTGSLEPGETPMSNADAGATGGDGAVGSEDAGASDAVVPVCGDGRVDAPHEECDDGPANADAFGACPLDCLVTRCGDGRRDPGEICLGPRRNVPGALWGFVEAGATTARHLEWQRRSYPPGLGGGGTEYSALVRLSERDRFGRFRTLWSGSGERYQLADFDGDGVEDLLTWPFSQTPDPQDLSVHLGLAGGGFEAPTIVTNLHRGPVFLDLGADGALDVVSMLDLRVLRQSGGTFQDMGVLSIGGARANAAYAVDFDGDGDDDLIVLGCESLRNVVAVFRQGSGGTLTAAAPPTVVEEQCTNPNPPQDVDGDGRPDILLPTYDGHFIVLFGRSDGTFDRVELTPSRLDISGYPPRLRAEDFDGDGVLDLIGVVPNDSQRRPADFTVRVWRQVAPRTFEITFTVAEPPAGAWNAWMADVDGDGRPDLVTRYAGAIGTRFARASGGLSDEVLWRGPSHFMGRPPRDVDGDGRADLQGSDGLLVGDGTGDFPAARFSPAASSGAPLFVDFDGDGHLDALTAFASSGAFQPGLGGGRFGGAVDDFRFNVPVGAEPATGDVNGDGRPDLVSVALDGALELRLAEGERFEVGEPILREAAAGFPVPAADLDGDGRVDLIVGREIWFGGAAGYATRHPRAVARHAARAALGDLDGDGVPDLAVTQGSSLSVHLGRASGEFERAPLALPSAASVTIANGRLVSVSPAGLAVTTLSDGRAETRTFPVEGPDWTPAGVLLADLDGDGDLDAIVTGHADMGAFAVLAAEGDAFSEPIWFGGGPSTSQTGGAIADVDGDGRPELLARFRETLSVLFERP